MDACGSTREKDIATAPRQHETNCLASGKKRGIAGHLPHLAKKTRPEVSTLGLAGDGHSGWCSQCTIRTIYPAATFEKSGLRRSANAANASRASAVCKRSRNKPPSRLICAAILFISGISALV